MKLFVALLSVVLSTSATSFASEIAALPEDPIDAAFSGLQLADAYGAITPGSADTTRAGLDLATSPMSAGATVRSIADIATGRAATSGTDASDAVSSALRHATILDIIDEPRENSPADVLRVTAKVARAHATVPALEATPLTFTAPSAALRALVEAAGVEWNAAHAADAAQLNALPEPTRTGILILLDTHVSARDRVEVANLAGEGADARAFITERVALALPYLKATTASVDLVDCGLYDIRTGADNSLHACLDANLITVDIGGDDYYRYNGGDAPLTLVDEPNQSPFRMLVDVAGDDRYEGASGRGRNVLGATLIPYSPGPFFAFFDLDGADSYIVQKSVAWALGSGSGGLFVDAAGDDIYDFRDVSSRAIGGDLGIFVEGSGNDVYRRVAPTAYAFCAGQSGGVALELGGNDDWNLDCNSAFGAYGHGLFVDSGAGDDVYTLRMQQYAFGGCNVAACTFRDDGGNNQFSALGGYAYSGKMGVGGSHGEIAPTTLLQQTSIGMMLVGPGDDTYIATVGNAQGVGIFGVGVLLDEGGQNTYSTDGSLSQGTADDGVGIFIDRGGDSSITMNAGIGQGSSNRGVGLLARTSGEAVTSYATGALAATSITSGGGVGIRVHRGPVLFSGNLPDFTCKSTPNTLASVSSTVLGRSVIEAYLCAPDVEDGEQIRDPVTHTEVDDITKPSVECRSGPLGDAGCEGYLTELWGEGLVDWLDDDTFTMRTSGGFSWLSAAGQLSTMFELQSVDNACKISCTSWNNIDRIG